MKKALAYFSHSYRWQNKELNLRIWKLLEPHFHFTVDPEDEERPPMEICCLEDMMRRSEAFIAVIPLREELPPLNCSAYQIFENNLAIRAARPRLLFIEESIDVGLFHLEPKDVITFDPETDWLKSEFEKVDGLIKKLLKQCQPVQDLEIARKGPVGILISDSNEGRFGSDVKQYIEQALRRTVNLIDPSSLRNASDLVAEIKACSVVIVETRMSWTRPDLLGMISAYCVPLIRLFHLENSETCEQVSQAMRLSDNDKMYLETNNTEFPILFTGYQVGPEMQPIIFWRQPEDLWKPIEQRLNLLRTKRRDLEKNQDAINYFLQLGRVRGNVFISNDSSLNNIATSLRSKMLARGIESFHYTDKDSVWGGHPDFPSFLAKRIKESVVFMALINKPYLQSKYCEQEMQAAIEANRSGRMIILPFLFDEHAVPKAIQHLQGFPLYLSNKTAQDKEQNIAFIVDRVVNSLEVSERLNFESDEREALVRIFSALDRARLKRLARVQLINAGVSDAKIEEIFAEHKIKLDKPERLLDRLQAFAKRSFSAANGLGRLINVLAFDREIEQNIDQYGKLQEPLARIIQAHQLLPDIRGYLTRKKTSYEFGIKRFSEDDVVASFDGLEDFKPVSPELSEDKIDSSLIVGLAQTSYKYEEWQEWLQKVGNSLAELVVVKKTAAKVAQKTASDGAIARTDIGLCLFGDERGLEVPFEWYRRKGHATPVCLEQPVRRFLAGVKKVREPVRTVLLRGAPIPLRTLIVGSDSGGIPRVEDESEDLREMFEKQFYEYGWPTTNVNMLTTKDVNAERLEDEIRRGRYDILHLAAHGDFSNEQPGIQIRPMIEDEATFLSAERLAQWAAKSSLRFVYLSICQSATPASESQQKIRRFDNLIQAFVKAPVPEVIGFIWPIEDAASCRFTNVFYNSFLKDFRAGTALLEARLEFNTDHRIWASPVLYSQCDSKDI